MRNCYKCKADKMTNLKQQLEVFTTTGEFLNWDDKINECCNFCDWFCADSALKNKATNLFKKVKRISISKKFDLEKTYVFFKNNSGRTWYDDFRICDLESKEVIYTVTPPFIKRGVRQSNVWGKENNWESPLVEGSWQDVVNFFKQGVNQASAKDNGYNNLRWKRIHNQP